MLSAVAKSSGALTGATTLRTGKAHLFGVLVGTDGTNDATVTAYDNTSAAGTVLFSAVVPGATGAFNFDLTAPVRADNGLHVVVSGTGASAIAYYG